MKFLHTADWHVGKTLKGRSRLDEQRAVLARIIGHARDQQVDAVLVAGDLYDSAAPTADAQQLVVQALLALRDAAAGDGSLLWELPNLLEAIGDTVTTDLPSELLPRLAAVADEIEDGGIVRAVIRHPLLKSRTTRYGSSLVPNLKAIREVAAHLFPPPGEEPIPWPTPKPSPSPKADAGG